LWWHNGTFCTVLYSDVAENKNKNVRGKLQRGRGKGGDRTADVLCLFPLESNHLLSDISGYRGNVFLPVGFCRRSGGGDVLHGTVEVKTRTRDGMSWG
jgi:hypothetical protein